MCQVEMLSSPSLDWNVGFLHSAYMYLLNGKARFSPDLRRASPGLFWFWFNGVFNQFVVDLVARNLLHLILTDSFLVAFSHTDRCLESGYHLIKLQCVRGK